MDSKELRSRKEELGFSDYRVCYKTGVHLGVIEDFFAGRTDELAPKDRAKIEALIDAAWKKR